MVRVESRGRLVSARPEELDQIKSLVELLDSLDTTGRCCLADAADRHVELPPSIASALKLVARAMAEGRSVAVVHYDRELTTQQAADLLNVSRPYLIRLLENGQIPYHMVGTHRRIRLRDLLSYKDRRDRLRRETLEELQRVSEALDLYAADEDTSAAGGEE